VLDQDCYQQYCWY